MAYLIRKGTTILVRKPSGEIVGHRCQKDCLFQTYEKVGERRTLQFSQDGFLVTVDVRNVIDVQYQCPQCGTEQPHEGLCGTCRASWLPKR